MLLSTNRLFCKVEAKQGEVDVFIGNLSPLNVAQVIELYRGDYLFIYLFIYHSSTLKRMAEWRVIKGDYIH